jgi:hypothetical protein
MALAMAAHILNAMSLNSEIREGPVQFEKDSNNLSRVDKFFDEACRCIAIM